MSAQLIILGPGLISQVIVGGVPVQVANTTMGSNGGIVINPLSSIDQGLGVAESLYVNITGPAASSAGQGTNELLPGQWFEVPRNSNVWVNAASSGHLFTAFFSAPFTPDYPPKVVPGQPGSNLPALAAEPGSKPFPPSRVTGLTTVIPSYLYQEYSDDDDLQGFVAAINTKQQDYVDTFNALNLPIYTGPVVQGALLDWVARGLYGMARPALDTGKPDLMGPLNTYGPNWLVPMWDLPIDAAVEGRFGLNIITLNGPENVVITNDDIYRRILTWHFYKGDGNYFSTRWLKRRIWRFLYGIDGKSPESVTWWPNDNSIADTEQISVTLGTDRNVTIRFVLGKRTVTGGALPNYLGCNGFNPAFGVAPPWTIGANKPPGITMNDLEGPYVPYLPLPYMEIFKMALDAGVLEVPYQYNFTCHIG